MQLAKAIRILCDAGVEFVVIGGVAGAFHGSAIVTYDLDICYRRTAENVRRLVAALAPFNPRPRGFPAGLPFLWDETNLRNSSILTLQTDIGEIDLLTELIGLGDFDNAIQRSILVEAFERKFATLDLPALIQTKGATGREKDRAALAELQSLLDSAE